MIELFLCALADFFVCELLFRVECVELALLEILDRGFVEVLIAEILHFDFFFHFFGQLFVLDFTEFVEYIFHVFEFILNPIVREVPFVSPKSV